MSFHLVLDRLRHAASTPQPGRHHAVALVSRRDLAGLIEDYDRIDDAYRTLYTRTNEATHGLQASTVKQRIDEQVSGIDPNDLRIDTYHAGEHSGYTRPADQVAEPGALAAQEMEWLEQWLLLAAEPIGQECCGQAHLECCGNAVPVYRTADEIASAMNMRREVLRASLAAGVKP